MTKPVIEGVDSVLAGETERIKAAYGRRQCGDLYSWFNPAYLWFMQARERQVVELLRRLGLAPPGRGRLLEIGCDTGYWLGEFTKWGARPENLTGIDLFLDRLNTARRVQPAGVGLAQANGAYLPFAEATFEVVLQATVFTSILEPAMKRAVAGEMLRVLKPRGLILWYDYHVNNPWNPEVRGVKRKEIQQLFPGCPLELKRVTLAPPLTRLLAPYSFLICSLLEKLRIFNTHYLGIIRKAA